VVDVTLPVDRVRARGRSLCCTVSDLFLAGNTDLLHFAVALGVPTLGIFTDADRQQWTPPEAEHLEFLASQEGERLSLGDLMERVDSLLEPAAR